MTRRSKRELERDLERLGDDDVESREGYGPEILYSTPDGYVDTDGDAVAGPSDAGDRPVAILDGEYTDVPGGST